MAEARIRPKVQVDSRRHVLRDGDIAPKYPTHRAVGSRPEEPIAQGVVSDLAPERPVSAGELDAIERLLGEALGAFLSALN
jgi:hypothetical protein